MNIADLQLSSELQELYLQNKHWLSDVLYLEDETRFFQTLFARVLSSSVTEDRFEEVQFINVSLTQLEERRNNLKNLIKRNQVMLESIMKDQTIKLGLDFLTENVNVISEIKSLFIADKLIKKELYSLVEGLILKDKADHLLNA